MARRLARLCNVRRRMFSTINPKLAIEKGWGHEHKVIFKPSDAILYSLGIGAQPKDPREIKFVYERDPDFTVFPTFPCIWSFYGTLLERVVYDDSMPIAEVRKPYDAKIPGFPPLEAFKFLDAERYIEIHKPLSSKGDTVSVQTRHVNVLNKRLGSLVETETLVKEILPNENEENDSSVIARILTSCFIKGLTGFESVGKPTGILGVKVPTPDRQPDKEITQATLSVQPALYRQGSRDFNPLHIDPSIAQEAGLSEPIMHGLCTMGFAARHCLLAYPDLAIEKIKSMRVRFAAPVLPGETLKTKIWRDDDKRSLQFVVENESGTVVVNNAYIMLQ